MTARGEEEEPGSSSSPCFLPAAESAIKAIATPPARNDKGEIHPHKHMLCCLTSEEQATLFALFHKVEAAMEKVVE